MSKEREGKAAREGGVRKVSEENCRQGKQSTYIRVYVRMYAVCTVAREYVWHIQYVSVHLIVRMCSTQKHSTCMYVTFI